MKRQTTDYKKTFVNHSSGKGQYAEYIKETCNSVRRQSTQFTNEQRLVLV